MLQIVGKKARVMFFPGGKDEREPGAASLVPWASGDVALQRWCVDVISLSNAQLGCIFVPWTFAQVLALTRSFL